MPSKCFYDGCKIISSYVDENTNIKACAAHKISGMLKSGRVRCKYIGCTRCASFNFPKSAGYKYCKLHSEKGMICKSKHTKPC